MMEFFDELQRASCRPTSQSEQVSQAGAYGIGSGDRGTDLGSVGRSRKAGPTAQQNAARGNDPKPRPSNLAGEQLSHRKGRGVLAASGMGTGRGIFAKTLSLLTAESGTPNELIGWSASPAGACRVGVGG